MPDWSFNLWELTQWGTDPARDAARDTARMGGGLAAPSLAEVVLPHGARGGSGQLRPGRLVRAVVSRLANGRQRHPGRGAGDVS